MASVTSGEGASQGGGGKFWKRPFRRQRATPYDRPPTALRNPSKEGWLTKLVDPASKLISAGGRIFFSSVFPKRLPPPSPEENLETRDRLQHSVPNIPLGVQVQTLDGGSNPANSSDGSGISELEQILKLKTFTSYEVDRLTELLRSKTVDLPDDDVDKRMELKVQRGASVLERQGGLINSQVQGTRVETNLDRFHGGISTCVVSSQVPEEEVATPAEIAKEYMGGLSNMSPSMLGLRHQALKEGGNLPNNVLVGPKSPALPLVPKAAVHGGAPENGFRTPRLRGRSAIYNMARMPYSRINPTSAQKSENYLDGFQGRSPAYDGYGGAFALSSQYARESDALKRRSCVLENDVGSVGPIRRLRQKTNLLTAKSFSLLSSGSLPSHVMGVVSDPDTDTTQSPASLTQKLPSLDGPNYRTKKTVGENKDNDIPSTSYTLVPSKSTDMATRIFHQLEKLVPKEKSSAGQVATVREKLPSKLTTNMLSGPALRSLEDVDSSKIIQDAFDNQKYNDLRDTSLLDARDTTSEEEDKVEENGPKTSSPSQKRLAPVLKSVTTVSVQDIVPSDKRTAEVIASFSSQHPQKKWAFHMSAHEDFLDLDEDLDDEIHLSEAGSTPLPEQREKLEKSMLASKAVSSQAVTVDKTPISSEMKTPDGPVMKQSDNFGASDPSASGEKKTSFTFATISSSCTSSHEALATQSTSAFDNNVPLKDQNAPTPLFSFSSDNIDKVSALAFSSPSSASEFVGLKGSAPTESKPESSYSLLATAASVAADTSPDIVESDKGDNKKTQLPGDIVGKPENLNSVLSTSISSSCTSSFGASDNNSSLRNGSIAPVPLFSSPTHIQASSTFTNHTANNFTDSVSSTTGVMSDNGIATTALIGSVSTTAADPPPPAATVFKFGSTIAPSNSVLTISTSSAEATDLKAKTEKETISANLSSSTFGGTSSEMPSTGNSIFGVSASANSSSTKGSLLDISSGSLANIQSSTVGTGISTFTEGMPMQFGLSASSLVSGTSSFTSSSSLFGAPAKVLASSPSFGLSSSASSFESNSVGSSGAASSLFGSSWQTPKSPMFNSTTGFSFGTSAASVAATNSVPMVFGSSPSASSGSIFSFSSTAAAAESSTSASSGSIFSSAAPGSSTSALSGSIFSFSSAAAASASSQTQPVFGSSVSVFVGNGDQMNMEDSMAEDPVQASTHAAPVFGQPPISNPSSSFVFSSTTPRTGVPFQFGGQQNQSTMQNTSPFQASGSLELGGGGSFSLGSGGGDKSGRKIVKVKHKPRRR